MAYKILLHPKVLKTLGSMHPSDRARVKRALRTLASDPFTPRSGADIRKLHGTGGRQDLYRLRIGKFRAIYGVVGNEVLVTDLFERRAGYEV